jgi:hypothetical protein
VECGGGKKGGSILSGATSLPLHPGPDMRVRSWFRGSVAGGGGGGRETFEMGGYEEESVLPPARGGLPRSGDVDIVKSSSCASKDLMGGKLSPSSGPSWGAVLGEDARIMSACLLYVRIMRGSVTFRVSHLSQRRVWLDEGRVRDATRDIRLSNRGITTKGT